MPSLRSLDDIISYHKVATLDTLLRDFGGESLEQTRKEAFKMQQYYVLPPKITETKKGNPKTGQWVTMVDGVKAQLIVIPSSLPKIIKPKPRVIAVIKPTGTPLKMWTKYFSHVVSKYKNGKEY